MSGVKVKAVVPSATSGTAIRTFLQMTAAANHRFHILSIVITYKGIIVTQEPHVWQVVRQTTVGTFAALPEVKANASDNETPQTAFTYSFTSTDPTTTDILEEWHVHPQSGVAFPFAPGDLVGIGGELIGIRLGVAPAVAANVSITVLIEE